MDDTLVERLSSEDFTPGTLTHKLLRYAEIQEAAETRTHGRPATNSWAVGFRQAVAKIDALNRELAEARSKALAEGARACRLYSEWCANWGMDQNMRAATEGANECATMLERLPPDLPADDDEAALIIHRTTDEGKRIQEWIENKAGTLG